MDRAPDDVVAAGRVLVALDVGSRCCGWLGNALVAERYIPIVQRCLRAGTTGPTVRAAHQFMIGAFRARLPAALEQAVAYVPRLLAVRMRRRTGGGGS